MSKSKKTVFVGILEKIEKAHGKQGVQSYLDSKGLSIPPVKLNSAEMELLKGGRDWQAFWDNAAAGYRRDGGIGVAASMFDSFF